MLPNASQSKNASNNNASSSSPANQRRYSLFGGPTAANSTASTTNIGTHHRHQSSLSKVLGIVSNDIVGNSRQQSMQARRGLVRRSTAADMMSTMQGSQPNVCQRCKRFEVDLTNTSDDLSATDAELKASRQVISLLQRQLELFRVEKEGLEKLIISSQQQQQQPESNSSDAQLLLICDDAKHTAAIEDGKDKATDLGDTQKLLLNLIKTQLYAKDEEIVKLKFNLKEAQNDKEQIAIQLYLLEEDNARLKSENSVLSENLTLRDQTIVSLSNEVFEQDNANDLPVSSSRRVSGALEGFGGQLQSIVKAQKQIAKLVDTLNAYKKTNELLSDNVIRLTDRCAQAEKNEHETRSQCQEFEAKCCQIQSKLLSLLKEIEHQSSQEKQRQQLTGEESGDEMYSRHDKTSTINRNQEVICSESVKLLIKRLLEDKSLDIPLSWKEGNNGKKENNKKFNKTNNSSSKYDCDELGFYIVSDNEGADEDNDQGDQEREKSQDINSSPKNSFLFMRHSISENNNNNQNKLLPELVEGIEADEQNSSAAMTGCKSNGSDNNNTKSNRYNRHFSVDATKTDEERWHYRWDNFIKDFDKIDLSKSKEFKSLLRSGVPQLYRCKVWKALIELRIGKEREQFGQDYYQSLSEPNRPQSSCKKTPLLNSSSKQIELDLLRTLPNNKHFEHLDSSGTVRLRRVLTAYSEHNPEVGYCQGMNRLAAVALLVLPEEEAFWCLVTIIDNIMPKGYYNDLWLAQVDSSVVMDFVTMKMPQLSEHFRCNSVELSLFAWFLTIFVDGTPPALFLRLWDSFLFEGDKILFRISLALLKMHESQLLKLYNSVTINNYLRSTVNSPINLDRFFEIAFDWINPLSSRTLKSKRQHNFQIMRAGFENVGRSSSFFRSPSSSGSRTSEQRRNSSKNEDSPFEDSSIISI